jgi:hypothetical protein
MVTLPSDKNNLIDADVGGSENYQAVSKPSIANKAEANEEN